MSRPSASEITNLDYVARELAETLQERSHRIDTALSVDPAFGSGWSESALLRDLVRSAVGRACVDRHIHYAPVNGSGREMRFLDTVDRRYRLRHGTRDASGELNVKVSSASALAVVDEPSLYMPELWAFVYVVDNDHRLVEAVAAEIVDITEGSPGRLVFGQQILLGGHSTPPAGFKPSVDDLDDVFGPAWREDEGDTGVA